MDQYSPKHASITPEYLLSLSKQIDTLNKHFVQNRLGSLTQDFSNKLTSQFNQLTQYLNLYSNDAVMKASSFYRCRAHLQLYALGKSSVLIGKDDPQLANIIDSLIGSLSDIVLNLQNLILEQRKSQLHSIEQQKDNVIYKLRREVQIKRQYTQQLQERVRQLQDQNSQLYSKIITKAKQTSEYAIRNSPSKIKQILTTTQLSISDRALSPRKKISSKAYEQQIYDILQSKFKQQSIQQRHTSLDDYLHTYFTVKYGKPLAQQNQYAFRQAISLYSKSQEKHIFLLFQTMIEELCEEVYYFEDRSTHEKIVKFIKRYLHERYNRSLSEVQRQLQWRNTEQKCDIPLNQGDLEPILSNIYKTREIDTLQMILNEIITTKASDNKLTCRRLINEILNYELSKHLLRVEDIVREAKRIGDGSRIFTFEQLQKIMVRVVKQKSKYDVLIGNSVEWANKKFTFSEVIEIIQKIRRIKASKRE